MSDVYVVTRGGHCFPKSIHDTKRGAVAAAERMSQDDPEGAHEVMMYVLNAPASECVETLFYRRGTMFFETEATT